MRKVAIIGHFGGKKKFTDGQTVKTLNLYNELKSATDWKIKKVDTYYKNSHPVLLMLYSLFVLFTIKDVIVLLSIGGMKFYFPILSFFSRVFKTRVYHDVIGGSLANHIKDNKAFDKYLNSFKRNWVETNILKNELDELGITNVDIIPNFRRFNPVSLEEFPKTYFEPFSFCTFSRVMAEKGIGDAIIAIESINKKYKKIVATLDIYGPVDDSYKNVFFKLLEESSDSVKYCGEVPSNMAIETLKKYVALLFPTRWVGESQAGTLSESCMALLPAIASDWRCNCEMVLDGKNGYLYPGQYAKTLEEAIEYFIEHKDNIYELRKNCSELAEQYQPDVHIKHIVEIIESN